MHFCHSRIFIFLHWWFFPRRQFAPFLSCLLCCAFPPRSWSSWDRLACHQHYQRQNGVHLIIAWLYRWNLSREDIVEKIFEGEMLTRTPPTNPLEIFCETITNSKFIVQSILDPDDKFGRNCSALSGFYLSLAIDMTTKL